MSRSKLNNCPVSHKSWHHMPLNVGSQVGVKPKIQVNHLNYEQWQLIQWIEITVSMKITGEKTISLTFSLSPPLSSSKPVSEGWPMRKYQPQDWKSKGSKKALLRWKLYCSNFPDVKYGRIWQYFSSIGYDENVAPDGKEFCAAIPAYGGLIPGSKTLCKGDSGGALLCNIDGYITFSGVLSRQTPFEDNCGVQGHPGVFIDLYYFSKWIREGLYLGKISGR